MKTGFPTAAKTRLQLLGAFILLAGLGIAAQIWLAQDRLDRGSADAPGDEAGPLSILDSRKQSRDLEIYYGKSALLFEEFKEWSASLVHGKRLAGTVAVAASLLAGGCFFAAGWLLPRLEWARLHAEAHKARANKKE